MTAWMKLKIFILSMKRRCTIWLHLSSVLEDAAESVMTESCQGWRVEHGGERENYKGRERTLESGCVDPESCHGIVSAYRWQI